MVVWYLKKIGKIKKKWVPHKLTTKNKTKKTTSFWGVFFSYFTQKQRTISQSDWKSGFYIKTRDDHLSDWTEKLLQSTSQSQTCTPQKSHDHCFMICCSLNPLQLSETITSEKYAHQINEMHQKLQCLQPASSIERVQFFSMTTPDCTSHNQCFKRWMNWATKFCLIRHIQLISRQLITLLQASRQLFAGKTLPQSVGGRKCFPKAHQYPKYGFLHYRNKLISHWQKCVDCNGSYFY